MRNLGSCFASPILLLLRNGATKYQTLISIIRQAPRALVSLISSEPSSLNFALRELKDHSSEAWYVELEKAEEKGISLETALSNLVNGASIVQTIFNLF